MAIQSSPQAWKAEDVQRDTSWILRLSPEEVDGLRVALAHAQKKVGKPLLEMTQEDFPLPNATRNILQQAINVTQGRWGMCLVKGFPTDEWTEDDMRLAYWGIGLYLGVARPQNRDSDIITDIRDTGGNYKARGGRGYNSNAELDFHQDSGDIVSLLCRRTAKSGGSSKVVSSIAIYNYLQEHRPDLIPVLQRADNWFWSWQNNQDPTQPAFYRCPILGNDTAPFCMRIHRKNIEAAQRDFPHIPRYTHQQREVLKLLETIIPSDSGGR